MAHCTSFPIKSFVVHVYSSTGFLYNWKRFILLPFVCPETLLSLKMSLLLVLSSNWKRDFLCSV